MSPEGPTEEEEPMLQKEVTLMPLIELPSGVSVRPDKIVFIARKEIGQYMLVMEGIGIAPQIDGRDLEVLRGLGVIQIPEAAPAANEPKIAT